MQNEPLSLGIAASLPARGYVEGRLARDGEEYTKQAWVSLFLPMTQMTQDIVKTVAKAIYESQVQRAREIVGQRDFRSSDMAGLFQRLVDETETAQIHIYFSYLDDKIKELIAMNLVELGSESAKERLFGLSGPLATFNTRTLIAYHLGWLSPYQRRRLDAVRKIRNEFGHAAYRVTSSDKHIAAQWRILVCDLKPMFDAAKRVEARNAAKPACYSLEELPEARKRLCYLALLANRTMVELLVAPVAKGHQVSMKDVAGNWEEGPDFLREISRDTARACICCMVKPDM